ncbi:GNAT family N-acetyltransferase [Sagittula sp. NFXS13]|uniref:RimJ/RimL family protein N-acetyltransferase n=1 Tax=Sagittula marina TaxID=943940 RepID=A0A7W6DK97_9RHOB|nr:GNAT family N-acetyltransferase [Sagittula marina]MBB3984099.1 RimJ/RimL family protein N-acetyltransferase [Sagittula marina]
MKAHISIATDRLVLRTPEEEDFDAVARFMASQRAQFVGGPRTDRFDMWRGFLSQFGHWGLRGYGMFTITRKGEVIGRTGLLNHVMWEEPELTCHIFDAGEEGKGYATEAMRAARLWAWEAHGLNRLASFVHPDNGAAQGVVLKLGAVPERETTLLGRPVHLWRHPEARQ